MREPIIAAGAVALLSLMSGCGMYYSRVGGTAHDKLYRGTSSEIGKAVSAALSLRGYVVDAPEVAGDITSFTARKSPAEAVSIRIGPGPENLVQAGVGSDTDWRKAVEIHRWIAVELGVLYRRQP